MLKIHYNEQQVCTKHIEKCVSKSPLKPKLVLESIIKKLDKDSYIIEDVIPLTREDFKLAHSERYINSIYDINKDGDILENRLPWSNELLRSLEYTNGSLYQAIKHSIKQPEIVHVSLTSGFHHAQPNSSYGFCTFSGQCIASLKIYNELLLTGCYIDLDAHFGNSIEDTRRFNKNINDCIPRWANFNPNDNYLDQQDYINEFEHFLNNTLAQKIRDKECHYIVYCHGADSIEGDDLNQGILSRENWLKCSHIFWQWYHNLCNELKYYIPVSLSLFGGYREDDYQYVIDAHTDDILLAENYNRNNNEKQIEFYNIEKTKI